MAELTLGADSVRANPTTDTFEPKEWLSRFTQAGGGYVVRESDLALLTTDDTVEARHLLAELNVERRQLITQFCSQEISVQAGKPSASETPPLNNEGAQPMNMMTAIPSGSKDVIPHLQFYSRETAPSETSEGQIVCKRLKMVPAGTSPALAGLIDEWALAYISCCHQSENDEIDNFSEVARSILEKIEAFCSLSYSDIAAKTAVAAFQLNGAGVVGLHGIKNGELLIRDKFSLDLHAEKILLSTHADAERLAGTADPLTAMLSERNQWLDYLDYEDKSKDRCDEFDRNYAHLAALERNIEQARPSSTEGVLAKLIFALQVIAEGHEIEEAKAVNLVREAMAVTGMGRLHKEHTGEPYLNAASKSDRLNTPVFQSAFDAARAAEIRTQSAEAHGVKATSAAYRESDAGDEYMLDTAAPSLEDVALKLRRAVSGVIADRWAGDLSMCIESSDAMQGLECADVFERMLWGAICDLEELIAFKPNPSVVTTWHQALEQYEKARGAYCNHPVGDTPPNDPNYDALVADSRKLAKASETALDAFLQTPSLDAAGVAKKLDVMIAEYIDSPVDEDRIAIIRDDALRLARAL